MATIVTPDTQVTFVTTGPDITEARFIAILCSKSKISAHDASDMYRAATSCRVSPLFFLAFFFHESKFGAIGICAQYDTHSPSNARSSRIGVKTFITDPKQGRYMKYPTWKQGALDACYRLVDPFFDYVKAGAKTIGQILPLWAPRSDSNDPEKYIQSVCLLMNQWLATTAGSSTNKMQQDPTNKIDIVHPDKGREGATPQVIVCHVQEGLNYLPDFFRSSGDDSTMWCMQDGTLVRMEQDTDSAWTNGFMTEPLDHANPIIQGLCDKGVTNSNNYSLTIEHQGFASGQFTDAAIESTAKMCAYWMSKYGWTDVDTRIVGHSQIGQHKNCPGPNFPWSKLKARVKELLNVDNPTTTYDPIAAYVAANGGEAVFGKRTSPGLYGTNGSVESDYYYAHLYVDKDSGKVVAEMKPRENPNGFSVGPGVLETARNLGLECLTSEQYYIPDAGQPVGLTKRSYTWAKSGDGKIFMIVAIQDEDNNNQPLPTWTRQVWLQTA